MTITEIVKEISGRENVVTYENDKVHEWLEWYQGKVKRFHSYRQWNGKRSIKRSRMSLGMAKKVCEDWANLLMNEKTLISADDEATQETLNNILVSAKFESKANRGIETAFALGGGAFVVDVADLTINSNGNIVSKKDAKIEISFVNATKIFPITIKNDRITECAFVDVEPDVTNMAIHLQDDNGIYHIYSASFPTNKNNMSSDRYNVFVNDFVDFNTGSSFPWFVYIKPNINNNIDIESPLGISIFANAIDELKTVDLIFDSLSNEFALGKKRIFVEDKMTTTENGDVFDTNDVAFYVLPEDMSGDGKTFIMSDTQPLRITEHQIGLQDALNHLSYKCGFGTKHYKFDEGGVATATQIISENSEMFRSVKKHEILLEEALREIVKIIIYVANEFTELSVNPNADITIDFDDSIIEDKETERATDRIDVSSGIMSKAEYRAKWYGEPLEVAEKKIEKINEFKLDDDYLNGGDD